MFETTRDIAACYTAVYGTMLCCTVSNCPLIAYRPSIKVANSQEIESCLNLLSSSNENGPDEALTGQRQNSPDKDTASGLAGYVCNHIHRPSNKVSQTEHVQRCWRKSDKVSSQNCNRKHWCAVTNIFRCRLSAKYPTSGIGSECRV